MIQPGTGRHPMLAFNIIWSGELISQLGSGLSGFAMGVWTFQHTGSITLFALIALASTLPAILVSPFAGTFIDRTDRRMVLLVCNAGLAVEILTLALLLMTQHLVIWYIYVAVIFGAVLTTFTRPAFTASITLLVPGNQLGRANGMAQLAIAGSQFIAPVLAGVLVVAFQLQGVLLVDFVSFLFAIVTLLITHIPNPARSTKQSEEEPEKSLWHDALAGWIYITSRTPLLALLIFAAIFNFLGAIPSILIQPLVLGFSSPAGLGLAMTLGGSGFLVGSLLLSVWKGPQRRILILFGGLLLCGLCLVLSGLQPSLILVTIGAFLFFFSLPAINSTMTTIQQRKVAADVQGRVFALSNMIGTSMTPLAYILAGIVSDHFFEPALRAHGLLSGTVGRIIGVGPGRGIGLFFIVVGLLLVLLTIGGYLYPHLRNLEIALPDVLPQEDIKTNTKEEVMLTLNQAT